MRTCHLLQSWRDVTNLVYRALRRLRAARALAGPRTDHRVAVPDAQTETAIYFATWKFNADGRRRGWATRDS